MCSSGPQGQTEALCAEGPSEQRAAERSADEQSEAEAPKLHPKPVRTSVLIQNFGLNKALGP